MKLDKPDKRKAYKKFAGPKEDLTIRPKSLKIRLPITVKDLATEMKLRAPRITDRP